MSGDVEHTPPLDDFLRDFREDDNHWWRIACGDHLNLFEEAVDRMEAAEGALRRVEALADLWDGRRDGIFTGNYEADSAAAGVLYDCVGDFRAALGDGTGQQGDEGRAS